MRPEHGGGTARALAFVGTAMLVGSLALHACGAQSEEGSNGIGSGDEPHDGGADTSEGGTAAEASSVADSARPTVDDARTEAQDAPSSPVDAAVDAGKSPGPADAKDDAPVEYGCNLD